MSCCTRFSSFHFGQSRDEAECSPLQLAHFWWLLQLTPSWPASHISHIQQRSCRLGAVAVFLALEAAQRVGNVWLDRDPQVTGCYVFWRMWRCKRQYYSVCTTSAISIPYMYDHSCGDSLGLKRVQQLKVERGISFPDARKAALSEQPTNAPRQTAAYVVSTAKSSVIQSKRKQTATVSVQTELTWPVGTDTPVPVKVNSQSTQTTSQQKNTSSP